MRGTALQTKFTLAFQDELLVLGHVALLLLKLGLVVLGVNQPGKRESASHGTIS